MHEAAYNYVARFATDERLSVIEVGARNVNGTVRPLFPNADYWGIDAQPGINVDEVVDGATWQPGEPVDLVVCTEVFEHTPEWRAILANIGRMLRPGGRAVVTMAGPGRPVHGVNADDPLCRGWYQNVTTEELDEAFRAAGFVTWEVDALADDVRGWGQM
jgi:SAM-dependent methyltransferase